MPVYEIKMGKTIQIEADNSIQAAQESQALAKLWGATEVSNMSKVNEAQSPHMVHMAINVPVLAKNSEQAIAEARKYVENMLIGTTGNIQKVGLTYLISPHVPFVPILCKG